MNILYVCTPFDYHDRKWMFYFSNKPGYKLFATWEDVFSPQVKPYDIEQFENANVTRLKILSSFSIKNPFKTYRSIKILNRHIKENNIDIVHFLFATPHALWGAFIKAPYVITARGSDVMIVIPGLQKSKGKFSFLERYLFRIFKRSFNNAFAITATSRKQIEAIHNVLKPAAPTYLIRTGVDVNAIANINTDAELPEELKGKDIIISPRFMSPVYNVETQIAAIKLLPAWVLEKYKFVFIKGREPYFSTRLAELKQIPGLDFIVYDRLTQQQMFTIYRYAKLTFMVPHSDGTPNTALEAMSARCPLILPNLDKYDSEIFQASCYMLKENTADELAKAMVACLENYPKELLEEGFNRANKFGNRAVEMEKLYAVYEKLKMQNS